jgi:allantoicase
LYGRRVAYFAENFAADSTLNLDLATVANGIYMVSIKNGHNSSVQKIVVQH